MALAPIATYSESQLQPCYNPKSARLRHVNLAAGPYLRGQCLGQITDTEAAAVQTLTITGTATAGNAVFSGQPYTYGAASLFTLQWNSTAAQAQAALDAVYGVGNTKVTGGAWPGTGLAVTFIGALSAQPVPAITVSANNLTGTTPVPVVTQTTPGALNTGTFTAYAHGNSDGSQVIKAVLMYGCTVDALGNITISAEIPGLTELSAAAYYKGTFRTDELVGLPTAGNLAVDFPGAVVHIGDLVSGVITIN
jgi:hypothetical protein